MRLKSQASTVLQRPQVCDDLQNSNEIGNRKNFVIEDGKSTVKGIILGIIFSIPIWILIVSFIILVIL